MQHIDLNCDMGERTHLFAYDTAKDLALLQYVSSVNLACGFHAGDAHTMHTLVEAALNHNIAVGAHPSFDDRDNFGRTPVALPPEMIYDLVLYQIGALHAFVKIYGARLHHVKPHGALYNMAAVSAPMSSAICQAVKDFDPGLILYGLSGSELTATAKRVGLTTASEVFADRTYRPDGTLTPRAEPGALIMDQPAAVQQVLQMVLQGTVNTTGNATIAVSAETICIHGDGMHALPFAAAVYDALTQQHVIIRQP